MKTKFAKEFYIEKDSNRELCSLTISAPILSDEDDYYCTVELACFFGKEKQIFGSDEGQALQLAIEFVVSMLAGSTVYDIDNKLIEDDNMKEFITT